MYKKLQEPLSLAALKALLAGVDKARVCLIGDFCLDLYWLADMRLSELSRETPHYPLPVVEERYSPGGAGNVVCNMAALQPEKLVAIGLIGNDWRGDLLAGALQAHGIDTTGLIRDPARVTNTYIKPLRKGISDVVYEDPRLDFEAREPVSAQTEEKLLAVLEKAAEEVDVICVSDQMKYGCITPKVREMLCALGRAGKTVVVDSRDRSALYTDVTVKPNEVEAAAAYGNGTETKLEELASLAEEIVKKNGKTTLLTLGGSGCFVADENGVTRCPACPVEPPIDFCGAGDTFLAGYGVFLAGGAAPLQAAQAANLCSAVTIKKLGTTGTATRAEVLAAYAAYYG